MAWDLARPDQPTMDITDLDLNLDVDASTLSEDGRYLAIGTSLPSESAFTAVIDLTRPPASREIFKVAQAADEIVFSPDSRYVAASDNATVRLWDLANPRRPARTFNHGGIVSTLAFSPDGRYLAIAGTRAAGDPSTRIWDLSDERRPPEEFAIPASAMAFSPDGRRIAADSPTGTQVWDRNQPDRPIMTVNHGGGTVDLRLTADRLLILEGSGDVLEWVTDTAVLPGLVCLGVTRAISESEWDLHASSLPYAPPC